LFFFCVSSSLLQLLYSLRAESVREFKSWFRCSVAGWIHFLVSFSVASFLAPSKACPRRNFYRQQLSDFLFAVSWSLSRSRAARAAWFGSAGHHPCEARAGFCPGCLCALRILFPVEQSLAPAAQSFSRDFVAVRSAAALVFSSYFVRSQPAAARCADRPPGIRSERLLFTPPRRRVYLLEQAGSCARILQPSLSVGVFKLLSHGIFLNASVRCLMKYL
jgi:hypothetical protein